MCDNVKISVTIPTYNPNPIYLKEAIESVLSSGFDPLYMELLVVDNCSEKINVFELCNSYSEVKYIKNDTNLGMIGNWNKCISIANGEFIHILHDDDWVKDGFYSTLINGFKNENICASFCRVAIYNQTNSSYIISEAIQETDGVIQDWDLLGNTKYGHHMSYTIFRKSTLLTIGGFNEAFYYTADGILNSNLIQQGGIFYSPKILGFYRWSDTNNSHHVYSSTLAVKEIPRAIKEIVNNSKPQLKKNILRFQKKQKSTYFFFRNIEYNRKNKLVFFAVLYYCFKISFFNTLALSVNLIIQKLRIK